MKRAQVTSIHKLLLVSSLAVGGMFTVFYLNRPATVAAPVVSAPEVASSESAIVNKNTQPIVAAEKVPTPAQVTAAPAAVSAEINAAINKPTVEQTLQNAQGPVNAIEIPEDPYAEIRKQYENMSEEDLQLMREEAAARYFDKVIDTQDAAPTP